MAFDSGELHEGIVVPISDWAAPVVGLWPIYESPARAFSPDEIDFFPEALQFKTKTDKRGVNGYLLNVNDWDSTHAGLSLVWQRNDGRYFIADGHQRLGFGKRMTVQNKLSRQGTPIMLNAIVLREAAGWTAKKARIFAAFKNIAESGPSTTATDVGLLLKDMRAEDMALDEAQLASWLPAKSEAFRQGKWLAELAPEAFEVVRGEHAKVSWGVLVAQRTTGYGEATDKGLVQHALLRGLIEAKPRSEEDATREIEELLLSGFTKIEQIELFGKKEILHSLAPTRRRIRLAAEGELGRRIKTIHELTENPDAYLLDGLALPANLALTLEQLRLEAVLLNKQANRDGPIAAELTRLAPPVHSGGLPLQAAVAGLRGIVSEQARLFLNKVETRAPNLLPPVRPAAGLMAGMDAADGPGLF